METSQDMPFSVHQSSPGCNWLIKWLNVIQSIILFVSFVFTGIFMYGEQNDDNTIQLALNKIYINTGINRLYFKQFGPIEKEKEKPKITKLNRHVFWFIFFNREPF